MVRTVLSLIHRVLNQETPIPNTCPHIHAVPRRHCAQSLGVIDTGNVPRRGFTKRFEDRMGSGP